ncbi:MAG: glycosyltransferase [Muribaculaceae bacterium]|nr:glycosyltransferase [Muribaculaceae bacterium]
MNRQPLISVIVPVSDVGGYVETCVDSILNQSYKNIELILVDDGSVDGSGAICDNYANKYDHIKVLHQDNVGPGAARNAGIEIMTGEYVTFVDADDVIHREYLSSLYKLLEIEKADVSTVSFVRFDDNDVLPTIAPRSPLKLFETGVDAVESMLYQQGFIDNSPCAKLYASRLFDTCRFNEGILYEDLATIPRVICGAKKVATTTTPMYFYRRRNTSITGTFTLKRCDVLDVVDELEAYMKQNHSGLVDAALSRKFSANMNMLWLMTITGVKDAAAESRCWENIKLLRKMAIINPKVRTKNKLGALISFGGKDFLLKVFSHFKEKK